MLRDQSRVPIRVVDLAVLLYHLHKAANHKEVGNGETTLSINELNAHLNKKLTMPKYLIESCLWACNMLDEMDDFHHVNGLTFKQTVNRIKPRGVVFNYTYNWFEEDDK